MKTKINRPQQTLTRRFSSVSILALLFLLAGTGCDIVGIKTKKKLLQVTVNLREIVVDGNCDERARRGRPSPGQWQFQISMVDEGNIALSGDLQLPHGNFGKSNREYLTVNNGTKITLDERITFDRPMEEGRAFSVAFAAYEWDHPYPDDRMNNRSSSHLHAYQNGRFSNTNIMGKSALNLGSGSCQARLAYTVTVQ